MQIWSTHTIWFWLQLQLQLIKIAWLTKERMRNITFWINPSNHFLIQIFYGVRYANAPTGKYRFSPTRSPYSWTGEKISSEFGPVCPQKFPEITPETSRLFSSYLKEQEKVLINQDEDCLFLNIYVPSIGEYFTNYYYYYYTAFGHTGETKVQRHSLASTPMLYR